MALAPGFPGAPGAEALPPAGAKAATVQAMFDRIAPRYDRLNAAMTFGLDRDWRRAAITAAAVGPGDVVVDVACGTGDLATLAAVRGAHVVGVDFAAGMLAAARRRGVAAALVRGDALALPVASGCAAAVTSAFALRNFVAIPPVLAEAARVLAPGGRLVLLESATPTRRLVRVAQRLWLAYAVPLLGRLLAERAAYRYLPASTSYLPAPAELRAMLVAAGFPRPVVRALAGGGIQLVVARREGAS